MKKKTFVAIIGSVMALSACVIHSDPSRPHQTQAQTYNTSTHYHNEEHRKAYVIQDRIDAQEQAIRNGIRSGTLTKKEARTLKHNIEKIKAEYKRAKKTDKYVSHKERERLDHMLDRNARMIRKLKGNDITRF